MALQRRDSRGQDVQPAGAPPRLKVERDAEGRLRVVPPPEARRPETIAEERPPEAPDPRTPVNPDHAGA